eukprot:CAMPEP_0195054868 /NCGR_PEP_ID=MMETSP0448-20130528/3656_1 /TAXON_ID=66468 /ORGANISM="Heterocapsa triquestra, Strain CCMP 448" /LENGTH=60 /DNA_ID=CAMNT_0040084429 /DNA_START=89 /DNA_END=268 /DNA_ORIENTATION=-
MAENAYNCGRSVMVSSALLLRHPVRSSMKVHDISAALKSGAMTPFSSVMTAEPDCKPSAV